MKSHFDCSILLSRTFSLLFARPSVNILLKHDDVTCSIYWIPHHEISRKAIIVSYLSLAKFLFDNRLLIFDFVVEQAIIPECETLRVIVSCLSTDSIANKECVFGENTGWNIGLEFKSIDIRFSDVISEATPYNL